MIFILYISGMVTGIDLKVKRIRQRLSLIQFAEYMDRSTGWISMMENGKISLTVEIVKSYLDALEAEAQEKV